MSNERIGVIGIGVVGSFHTEYLKKGEVPGAELTAVCDINPERLAWATENLGEGVQQFAAADELMASGAVDAVMIAVPHYFHPPMAIQALESGLHALVEKPAGVYTRQVREMNEAAARSDRVFGIMLNQRTVGAHQKVKELVESGEIGRIQRTNYTITNWFRAQSYYDSGGWRATWAGEGGGVLCNQAPHNIDLWQWICGMPARVRAWASFGKYHNIEVEDEVTAYVEYEDGATGVFVTTTGEAPGTNRMEIAGDRGKLLLEDEKITFWRTRVPVSQFCREWKEGFGRPETWKCEIPAPGGGGGHSGITAGWVEAIRSGNPIRIPGEDGINGVQLANAMLLSTWTDGWVDIPVDEDLYYDELQKRVASSQAKKDPTQSAGMDVQKSF